MALTESSMMQLGTHAPAFTLLNTNNHPVATSDFLDKPLLVMFICNHCPYVKHVADQLAHIGRDFQSTVGIVAIQSNDVEEYPDDSPEKMKQEVIDRGYVFPYLHDATQEVALAFSAACTPDFFLFDADHKLAYRGRLDETRPTRVRSGVYDSTGNEPTGVELRTALNAVVAGTPPKKKQLPSLGCNIKWNPENASA